MVWLLVSVLALFGCSSGYGAGAVTGVPRPASPLVLYQGSFVTLFDDGIDANAVGIADVNILPRNDVTLRARTQQAEIVARMRVSTVTVDQIDGQPLYHVQFNWIGAPLVQRGSWDNHLDIAVRPESPSFGVVKWLDTRLIGRSFIGFARRFSAADDAQIRFHLSQDSAEVLKAVEEAVALGEVVGP